MLGTQETTLTTLDRHYRTVDTANKMISQVDRGDTITIRVGSVLLEVNPGTDTYEEFRTKIKEALEDTRSVTETSILEMGGSIYPKAGRPS